MAGAAALLSLGMSGTARAVTASGPSLLNIYVQAVPTSPPGPTLTSSPQTWNDGSFTSFNIGSSGSGASPNGVAGTVPLALGSNIFTTLASPQDSTDTQFILDLFFDNGTGISALLGASPTSPVANTASSTTPSYGTIVPGSLTVVDGGDSITLSYYNWSPFQSSSMLGQIALTVSAVPEPASLMVVGAGLAGLAFARRRPRAVASV